MRTFFSIFRYSPILSIHISFMFRTGALRVGDRILAINGACLRGRTLRSALQLLRGSGKSVNLKILRVLSTGDDKTQFRILESPARRDFQNVTWMVNLLIYITYYDSILWIVFR